MSGVAFQPHSDTSRAVAGKIESSSKKQAAMIESWADAQGWHGVTIDEGIVFLSEKFGRDMQASPRFRQLEEGGRLVKASRKRNTRAGHPATVYVTPRYDNGGPPLVDKPKQTIEGAPQPAQPAPIVDHGKATEAQLSKSGHGHVVARRDGHKARCGCLS